MTPYRRALIVGAGPGLGASLARAFAGECGMRFVVAARRREPLEAMAAETGATPFVTDASNGAAGDALFDAAALGAWCRARRRRLQRQPARSRIVRRGRCPGGRARGRRHSDRRLSRRPASRVPHAAVPTRCGALHGRFGRDQGGSRNRPRSRWASLRCAASRRGWRGSWQHRASMSLMSSSTAQSVSSARRTTTKTRSSTPTPLLPPTCTCLRNRAASGNGRSRCVPGSSASERRAALRQRSRTWPPGFYLPAPAHGRMSAAPAD